MPTADDRSLDICVIPVPKDWLARKYTQKGTAVARSEFNFSVPNPAVSVVPTPPSALQPRQRRGECTP